MIPSKFDYEAPATLADALSLLVQNSDAKILAGGQSLIPLMRFRMTGPSMLIDINGIEDLSYIKEEGGWLKIGSMTRESDIDHSDLIRDKYPLLYDTAKVIADPIVRNMATVGGNIAHADPANDHPATMLAYRANVVAAGPGGERTIPISEFFTGPFEMALAADEILTEIQIPAANGNSGGAYYKVERKVGDYATAAVAVQVTLDGGNIAEVGIGLTNVGLVPIQATAAEDALRGNAPNADLLQQAGALAAEAADPVDDRRGTENYKRALVRTLTVRALNTAIERAGGG